MGNDTQGARPRIDFKDLADSLLARAETLVPQWLPGGKRRGAEWVCGGLDGRDGHSCSINMLSGAWADFSGDEAGGDLISLYAAVRGLKQIEAARELQGDMGWQAPIAAPDDDKPKKRRTMWRALDVAPAGAPAPMQDWQYKDAVVKRWVKLQAVRMWTYQLDGELFGYVGRFERASSKTGEIVKDTLPQTWCIDESDDRGGCTWRWKMWEGVRPLYVPRGSLSQDGRPVVVVEGEKCAQALHELVGDEVDAVSWPGGVNAADKARWSWLMGRTVVLWPDCDSKRVKLSKAEKDAGVDPESKPWLPVDEQPGRAAMLEISRLLQAEGCSYAVLDVAEPGQIADGWDVADAIAEGWTADQVFGHIADGLDKIAAGVPEVVGDEPPPWMDEVEPADAGDAEAAAPAQGGGGTVVEVDFAAKGKNKGKAKKTPEKKSDDFWALIDGLAERYSLIYGTDQCWDHTKRVLIKIAHMRLAHGSDPIKFWLARPSRRMVDLADLVFEPGQEVPAHQINMFGGLALRPVPCDAKAVAPMLALLRHLCSGSGESADDVDAVMHWVLCWMALPLQQLGTKMQTALVFHGAQGTGKNLFFDVWRDLYGDHGITVGQTEIEDKFNGWISRKLAIVADEVVSRQEMYHKKNTLKSVVTQEKKFPIRGMQMETRWESNHANVVFLSNESMPLALEERDRRYAVVYTPLEADEALYIAVRDFLAAGGREKWLHYLQTYAIGEFNAHTKPLMTRAKEKLIELNWKSSERFAHEWLNGFLPLPVRVCSAGQLYRAFRRWADQTGEKWPPAQPLFTGQVERWINERVGRDASGRREQPVLVYKVVALKDAVGNRKSVRCWLPTGSGPAEGVTEGEWAAASVDAFDADVDRFCRRPGSDVEDAA